MSTTRIESEVNARVLRVEVAVGDEVGADDVVMMVESMKMEIPVQAEAAGRVSAIHVAEGDTVEEGQLLVELAAS
ncbi:acetyl-CoA carboxylase biotin carboxyl carrier protein subunit [Pusillimonas sp. MFBS29]|uniref:acetyl-CoA carboxylase biotin carboxyl carrier protein subunit n=1 Tax=Pusillimonas sp. MFBS29 TaxID=2886690 RepID=UPI001D12D814|nr:acetyl-CoA carboxylase biotin carboxyl carrier protein subunit [Pusillimonas sp. MFBS29]